MSLKTVFKDIIQHFQHENIQFALAGGMIASLYRTEERLTQDLDFLIFAEPNTLAVAQNIIKHFGLQPNIITKAELEGGPLFAIKRKSTAPYMVVGRSNAAEMKIGLDFILPTMPWFAQALERSAYNVIDFGFAKIPCLTVEDVIIAKIYAVNNSPMRFKDLDDLQSIFKAAHDLDFAYLVGELQKYDLKVSSNLKKILPKALRSIWRGSKKHK